MDYSVAIRTLGRAGHKYQTLLDSLKSQTIKPKDIYIYIAEGYPIPEETIGFEKYVYVKKGMVAQRALRYEEIVSEYILFLDDDLFLPSDTVEKMFALMREKGVDVISPDVMPNHKRDFLGRIMMMISARMVPRRCDSYWGYKVMPNAGYSYNMCPDKDTYYSQTNAGACFLCKKEDFLKIKFDDELWLDQVGYPLGEDQVMYYKMYLYGLKQLTWYTHNVIHLDAGANQSSRDKVRSLIFSDFRFKLIFWHRFIFRPCSNAFDKMVAVVAILYTLLFTLVISIIKLEPQIFKVKWAAIMNALEFIKSEEYHNLSKI